MPRVANISNGLREDRKGLLEGEEFTVQPEDGICF